MIPEPAYENVKSAISANAEAGAGKDGGRQGQPPGPSLAQVGHSIVESTIAPASCPAVWLSTTSINSTARPRTTLENHDRR